jgi:uncharacterized protein (DUF302 family)
VAVVDRIRAKEEFPMAIHDHELASRPLSYGYKTHIKSGYPETVARVKEELAKEGFGVLSEIDVQSKLAEKIGVEFRKYIILGACNPQLAYEALRQELDIGLMLPCNVIVYEDDTGCMVAIVRPDRIAETAQNPALEPIAAQADESLLRVLNRLS